MRKGSLIAHAWEAAAPMPYAALPDTSISIVESALRVAWDQACTVQSSYSINFLTADEEQISAVLTDVLGALCADTTNNPMRAFNEFFHMAIAEGTVLTKASARVETAEGDPVVVLKSKRPDYAIWPKSLPPGHARLYYAIFVEAKILDKSRSMYWYCNTGLRRFVAGEYAWSMRQGIMLAYLCDTSQALPGHLNRYLSKRRTDYGVMSLPEPCVFSRTRTAMRVYETTHGRDRVYCGTRTPLGPIRMYHLWLTVP